MAEKTQGEGRTAGIGDEAVKARTGKTWKQWLGILDRAGAKTWGHKEIVSYLDRRHGIDGWWCQMITVGYEQARGKREVHQNPEGFQVGGSRTIGVPVGDLYRAWRDGRTRGRWLDDSGFEVRKATPNKSMRITWVDGRSSVDVNFYSKGRSKSQVSLQHGKLPDAKAAARMKAYWKENLGRLKELLDG